MSDEPEDGMYINADPVVVDCTPAVPKASETSTMGLSITTAPLRAVEERSSFSSLLGFLNRVGADIVWVLVDLMGWDLHTRCTNKR